MNLLELVGELETSARALIKEISNTFRGQTGGLIPLPETEAGTEAQGDWTTTKECNLIGSSRVNLMRKNATKTSDSLH